MDRAALDAYGWTAHEPKCEFLLEYDDDDEEGEEQPKSKPSKKKKPWRYRWPDDFRDEVLARLLALNAERAEQERLMDAATEGLGEKKRGQAKAKALKQTGQAQQGIPGLESH